MISFLLEDPRALPGETIRGTVGWSTEGKAPQAVVITAGLESEGRGTTDKVTVYERTVSQPLGEGSADFEFVVPTDAPCTYDGQLIRIKWRVEVRLDLPWARDERSEAPFAVVST